MRRNSKIDATSNLTPQALTPFLTSLANLASQFLEYLGNSLNAEQVKHVRAIAYTADLKFFGRDLSDGVMGYISPSKYEITFFATPKDTKSGIEPIRTYSFRDEFWDILDIHFTSSNRVLMSSKTRACVDLAGGYVVDMPSLEELEKCLLSRSFDPSDKHKEIKLPLNHCERLAFAPSQWCTNAATFTALDKEGKVCTLFRTFRMFNRDIWSEADVHGLDLHMVLRPPLSEVSRSILQRTHRAASQRPRRANPLLLRDQD